MPSPRILDFGPDPLNNLFSQLGQGLSQNVQQGIESQNIEDLLGSIRPDASQEDVLKQILSSRKFPLQQKAGLYDAISSVRQQTQQQQATDQLAEQLGLPKGTPIEYLIKEREARVQEGKTAGKLSPEEQLRRNLKVKEQEKRRAEAEEAIPKIQDQLSNLDHAENLAKRVSGGGVLGQIGGQAKAYFRTEDATELENVGTSAIEAIVKLFNPVGAISTQKFLNLKRDFSVKASDFHGTKIGKINALRRLYTQALNRHQNYLNLLAAYDNNPPKEVLNAFSKDTENDLDNIAKQEKQKLKGIKEDAATGKVTIRTPEGREFRVDRDSPEHQQLISIEGSVEL